MTFGNITISDVRVLAGLDHKTWRNTIILGLNVLNYFTYTINRDIGSGFIDIQLGRMPAPANSNRSKFDHLIGNNSKYITNSDYLVTSDIIEILSKG